MELFVNKINGGVKMGTEFHLAYDNRGPLWIK